MFRLFLLTVFIARQCQGLTCEDNPCVNGKCSADVPRGTSYKCICEPNWAGNRCDLPEPDIVCGNKSIEIFIDTRIVTEQGLPGSPEFVHFMEAPGCQAKEMDGGFYLKVDSPFNDCGMIITHDGGDYTFYQQIVWNRQIETVERPLVLLDFKCTYQDKYTVSFGEITPFVTTVDVETSYGTFKVDMNLYKNSEFNEEDKYGARPVVKIEDEVCVSTELKNVMPKDLVLTNRACWASTDRDGGGETHYLVSGKCEDDPTTSMISNGESDFGRFCFQMFKWKDSMDELYLHCLVTVCNATAWPEFCQCPTSRSKRSIPKLENEAHIRRGPIFPVPADVFDDELPVDNGNIDTFFFNRDVDKDDSARSSNDSKTTILIAVGVVLVIALIVLGVVVAVYINCRRKSRDQKAELRSAGEPVVIPNPANEDAMMH